MTELLKKGVKFYWSNKCEEAFQKLKTLLTSAPILASRIPQNHSMFIVMPQAQDSAVS